MNDRNQPCDCLRKARCSCSDMQRSHLQDNGLRRGYRCSPIIQVSQTEWSSRNDMARYGCDPLMQRSVNDLSNTILILADLRQTFDALKWAIAPKPNSQKILQFVFHSIQISPELATRFHNTNGKPPFVALARAMFSPVRDFVRKRIGSWIFALSSQPLKYGSRYYTGHESGTQEWLKSEEMWAGRAFDKPLSPNGIKRLFWSQGAGSSTEMSIEYHTLEAGQLVPKSGNGYICTVSCQTVPFMFLSTFLIALCLEKYSTDWKYRSQAQIIPSRCKNISLK